MNRRQCTVAGLSLGALALAGVANAAVTFEFRQAPGDHFEQIPAEGTVSFDAYLIITGNERVGGVGFLLYNEQYANPPGHTFYLSAEPDRAGSVFLGTTPGSLVGERLVPMNKDGGAPDDLGGYVNGVGYIADNGAHFIASFELTAEAGLSPGTYRISPNHSATFAWTEVPESGPPVNHEFQPSQWTAFEIQVVPEPTQYAVVAGLGLSGVALCRRLRRSPR